MSTESTAVCVNRFQPGEAATTTWSIEVARLLCGTLTWLCFGTQVAKIILKGCVFFYIFFNVLFFFFLGGGGETHDEI